MGNRVRDGATNCPPSPISGSAEEWRKQKPDDGSTASFRNFVLIKPKGDTENVSFVLIDRDRDRRVVLRRERPEAVVRKRGTPKLMLVIIACTPGRQGSAL